MSLYAGATGLNLLASSKTDASMFLESLVQSTETSVRNTSNNLARFIKNTSNIIEENLQDLKYINQISYDETAQKYTLSFKTDKSPSTSPLTKIDEDQKLKTLIYANASSLGASASGNPIFYPSFLTKITHYVANGNISLNIE